MPPGLNRLPSRTCFHGDQDIPAVSEPGTDLHDGRDTHPPRTWHMQALSGEGTEGRLPAMHRLRRTGNEGGLPAMHRVRPTGNEGRRGGVATTPAERTSRRKAIPYAHA